jgi:hypothetical protein
VQLREHRKALWTGRNRRKKQNKTKQNKTTTNKQTPTTNKQKG